MEYMDLPNGNGKKVYFDLGDSTPGIIDHVRSCGYKPIFDPRDVDEDTFCFDSCVDEHIHKTKERYRAAIQRKVDMALANAGIEPPKTIRFGIDSFPKNLPDLPFVLKNEAANCGAEKYLIETEEQLEILKEFYEEATEYNKLKGIGEIVKDNPYFKNLIVNDAGKTNTVFSYDFIDYKEEFYKTFDIQEYIETPTEYNTSLRVLTSSSGDILGASLKYSKGATEDLSSKGLVGKYLSNPDSMFYLNSKSIVSNTASGGESILLESDNYTEEEKRILLSHNIDPDNAFVPDSVSKACIEIALSCKREIGAICGIDFIYDVKNKKWKYLEEHEYPMLFTYASKYGLPYRDEFSDMELRNHQFANYQARLHSLALTVQKERNIDTDKVLLYRNLTN